jgi:hypothetical protein
MKRICILAGMAVFLSTPSLSAQTHTGHFEAGVFASYLRLNRPDPDLNLIGIGGRGALNLGSHAQLEVELSYALPRTFSSLFSSGSGDQPVDTRLQTTDFLVGPKFDFGPGPLRPFFTLKAGWVHFQATNTPPVNFEGNLGKITSGGSALAFYPAAGVEKFWGRLGARLEVGDELYYDGSLRSNLRVTLGPQIRF